jgi:hypothetical protein
MTAIAVGLAVLSCASGVGLSDAIAQPPASSTRSGAADPVQAGRLALGSRDLPETRSTRTLQPGVTLTEITRGKPGVTYPWTLEALIPATSSSPDPDAPSRTLSDKASANAQADRLRAKGFAARVEAVAAPKAADVPSATLGYRVRVGSYSTKAEVDADRSRLVAAGESASTAYTGWDGDAQDQGPWHLKVVTIDPRTFRGSLGASYGPDLYNRETTSSLSRAAGATVGVNAGFFVLDPASGAPGDPAGVGVYHGRLLSEPTNGRPALVVHGDGGRTSVQRLRWKGNATVGGHTVALDGVDRVPGLIRNCGGEAGDSPTSLPMHDTTCTDADELVAFTPQYGHSTPSGAGREVIMDAHGMVTAVSSSRGTALMAGQRSLQGIGAMASALSGVHVGDRVSMSMGLVNAGGAPLPTNADTTVVNGGPQLVHQGHVHTTPATDGMMHPGDPSFAYGWVVKRNPRTFAGVDAHGRTVLVTVDGRSVDDLGLSIPEAADAARSLGLMEAMNLDGGGSTTMAVDGQVITHPSDATGERPVGDALLVSPRRG